MEYIFLSSVVAIASIIIISLKDKRAVNAFATILMLSVPLLGQASLSLGPLTSNVGNIFYAGAVFTLMAGVIIWGKEYGFKAVKSIFLSLMAFNLFATMVAETTGIGVQHQEVHAELFALELRIVAASYIAFYAVQSGLVYLTDKFRYENLWFVVPSLAVAVQAIDSLIFFPLAFGGLVDGWTLLGFSASGFVLKVLFALCTTPFLVLIQKDTILCDK